ncbi:MAG: DUF4147 domain-containing protein [Nitrososphaeria archaeon]|nr:DUF4147 domain-containing protein [Nitrososphaeria archaeon]
MKIIKNFDNLISQGNVEGRKIVLDILEEGLKASDPYDNVRKLIKLEGSILKIDCRQIPGFTAEGNRITEPLIFDLNKVRNIYVVGGGKAAQRMAKAIEDILGEHITEGHVNAKKGEKVELKRIEVTLAGHPLPDEDSVEGSKRILEILKKARKGDIVFFAESGGASALMALPGPGISLEDIRETTRMLYFDKGATMWDTNVVRWNLMILRGKERRYVNDATLIAVHTDERPPGVRVNIEPIIRGYNEAIKILKKYDLWDKVPVSVKAYLEKADPQYGPLKLEELVNKPHYHFRVMGPEYMLDAAKKKAEDMGINATILASSLSDIEAKSVGETLAYIANEVEVYGRPLKPPAILLCGGEVVVSVGGKKGVGGRNQELVLSAAVRISNSKNIVIASVDSDGTDGPTDAAGGIVDGYTVQRAKDKGINVLEELEEHNSYNALSKLSDLIFTGARGTNVQDLRAVFVGGKSEVIHIGLPDYLRTLIQQK